MIQSIRKRGQKGQGMTEYLIITALMAVSAIAVLRTTSNSMKVGFGKVANALQGKEDQLNTEKVNTGDVEGKNMNDFNDGVKK